MQRVKNIENGEFLRHFYDTSSHFMTLLGHFSFKLKKKMNEKESK